MDKVDYYKQASKNRKKNKVIDWVSIRNEYETTSISIKKLALKHKINYHTIKDKSFKQKWGESKRRIQKELKNKTTKKTIENISDKQSKAMENHYKISEYLLYKIGNTFKNEKEFNTFVEKCKSGFEEELKEFVFDSINDKKVLNLVNAFEKIQKSQRQTLGIADYKDEINKTIKEKELDHKFWLEREKLKLQKAEFEYKKWLEKEKLKKDDIDTSEEDDGFIEALNLAAEEIWEDDIEDSDNTEKDKE